MDEANITRKGRVLSIFAGSPLQRTFIGVSGSDNPTYATRKVSPLLSTDPRAKQATKHPSERKTGLNASASRVIHPIPCQPHPSNKPPKTDGEPKGRSRHKPNYVTEPTDSLAVNPAQHSTTYHPFHVTQGRWKVWYREEEWIACPELTAAVLAARGEVLGEIIEWIDLLSSCGGGTRI